MKVTLPELKNNLENAYAKLYSSTNDSWFELEREIAEIRRSIYELDGEECAIQVDLGFKLGGSGSGEAIFMGEGHSGFLLFVGYQQSAFRPYVDDQKIVVLKFEAENIIYGYPNDEALAGHRLAGKGLEGYGVYEVLGGSWESELIRMNKISFPNTSEDLSLRHLIFTFKETTCELLVDSFCVEFYDEPWLQVFQRKVEETIAT